MLAEKIQLEPDETILIQVRKHWFILFMQLLGVLIAAVFPFVFGGILSMTPAFAAIPVNINSALVVALYTCWLIFSWMALFGVWTNYYLDVWTITNKRLVKVDQQGLFNRDTGSFRLERLQDINVSVHGIIPTLLEFGDIQAETASEDRSFVARGIPKPQELKALILKAADDITFTTPSQNGQLTAAAPAHVNDGL